MHEVPNKYANLKRIPILGIRKHNYGDAVFPKRASYPSILFPGLLPDHIHKACLVSSLIFSSKLISAMNSTKLVTGTLVGFVFVFLLDYLFYGILMKGVFQNACQNEMPNWTYLILGLLIFMAFFTYIYGKGVDAGGSKLQQAIRYGVVIGLMVGLGYDLIAYSLEKEGSMSNTLIDAVYSIVRFVLAAIVIAYVTNIPATGTGGDRGKDAGGGQEMTGGG
jgi:hypothetical protein